MSRGIALNIRRCYQESQLEHELEVRKIVNRINEYVITPHKSAFKSEFRNGS